MAKSKSGGSRAYLRGRIGADVYSIGKDSKGKKQQVVRSLAETVANPQTLAQMRGRMIMSTVMQASSALNFIIDHSFDGFNGKQANISEFIRRNYALIKADVAAHPSTGNSFGLNQYQEKGIKAGAYVVASGSANVPTGVSLAVTATSAGINVPALTVGAFKAEWGLTADEYITLVAVVPGVGVQATRLHFTTALADDTAITSANVASLFTVEGTAQPTFTVDTAKVSISLAPADANGCGVIVTRKENGSYVHSDCQLSVSSPEYTSDIALPTYPVGTEMFLNGGDI